MGYLPFAYYTNNPEETTALPLAETTDGTPVEPSLDNASNGDYPLARPLFFYANSNRLEDRAVLQEFVRFYINQTDDTELIANQIGYVPASDELVDENLSTLEEYAGSGE